MTLSEKITEDLNTAMKAGEKMRVQTLRMLRASMIELMKSGKEVTPDDEMRAVMNQAKRRKDAITEYTKANRQDLADVEAAELKIIEEFLPQQLGEDEIRKEVREIIASTSASGPQDFKLVMPKAMASMRGRADGNIVQQIVKEELGG